MYAVVFYEEYVGSCFDEYSKIFHNKTQAQKYAKKLNKELATANFCNVVDLGDYYIVTQFKADNLEE